MKRWLTTVLVFGICSAVVRADITVVQTATIEGGVAAMAAPGATNSSKLTMRVKGLKSRTDMELDSTGNASAITDIVAKQVIVLKHGEKTAQTVDLGTPASPGPELTLKADVSAPVATGKSQVIDGLKCDEFTFSTTMSMVEVIGAQLPPEAVEAMKGLSVVMKTSMWVTKDAPGAAEYSAYYKALGKTDLAAAALKASGVNVPGLDKLMKALTGVDGLNYLTVMDMALEGTGPMADMMRQMMSGMKITTKVTSISADAIGEDQFKIPEGYTVVK